MSNSLLSKDQISNIKPGWSHPVLPGHAVQGSVLMTRTDFVNPPQSSENFIWMLMEDVFGVHDMKIEYDSITNEYKLLKSNGHLNNDGTWIEDWYEIGKWQTINEEVAETLAALVYIEYTFESTNTSLVIKGKKKDGTIVELANLTFSTTEYVDAAIANLTTHVNRNIPKSGTAISVSNESSSGRSINVRYNNDDFSVDENNNLKSEIIDDELNSSLIKTWSIDKIKDVVGANGFRYVGEVEDIENLPATGNKGDVYYVRNKADLYLNNSNTSSTVFLPFTKVAEDIKNYAIELHKSASGIYAKLNYDNVDFVIDSLFNLKSQLIDDTIVGTDPLATRKTYSVAKILQLISTMFRYKGQVDYYDELPTTGLEVGDCYNVRYYRDTPAVDPPRVNGDNYAWNGTGWDDLSGEYIAGAGITIEGKVITATGISFNIGDGLMATGSGSTTTLQTRINNGMEYVNVGTELDPVNALGVKAGSGIAVNAAGVNVRTGETTQTVNNNIEVKPYQGLENTANGVSAKLGDGLTFSTNDEIKINANFTEELTPLGIESSGLKIFSDGKIAIDTQNVILGAVLLWQGSYGTAAGQAVLSDSIDNYSLIMIQDDGHMTSLTPAQLKAYTIENSGINVAEARAYTRNYTYIDNTHINYSSRDWLNVISGARGQQGSTPRIYGLRLVIG